MVHTDFGPQQSQILEKGANLCVWGPRCWGKLKTKDIQDDGAHEGPNRLRGLGTHW